MNPRDLVELVRAPAALTVPGDSLAGGAASLAPAVTSVCLYWAGMALNDYADRDLDAKERPERPIPSGRVSPRQALALATGLTAAGVVVAACTGGRRRLAVALPLAATVWAYDLKLKNTPAGPVAMAAARGLDVLLGASFRNGLNSAQAAAAVAVHTYGITSLSQGEVNGASGAQVGTALVATGGAMALAVLPIKGDGRAGAFQLGLAGAYAGLVGQAQVRAAIRRDAPAVRSAVGAGILGILPLQASLAARQGRLATAAAIAAIHPLARRLARKVSPT